MRSKGRERRAVKEGDVPMGSALFAVHGGGRWRRVAVVIHLHRRPLLLLSFVAVVRSCPSRLLPFLSVAGGRWWWCRVTWVWACPIVAGGGRGFCASAGDCLQQVVSFARGCVACALLCRFRAVVSFPRCSVVSELLCRFRVLVVYVGRLWGRLLSLLDGWHWVGLIRP